MAAACVARGERARRGLLGVFVQREAIDVGVRHGVGVGAEVEDPEDLDDGEEDVAGAGGLHGGFGRVDEGVCGRAGEDQAGGEEADDGDLVAGDGVEREHKRDPEETEELVGDGPPGEAREVGDAVVDVGDHLRDE